MRLKGAHNLKVDGNLGIDSFSLRWSDGIRRACNAGTMEQRNVRDKGLDGELLEDFACSVNDCVSVQKMNDDQL